MTSEASRVVELEALVAAQVAELAVSRDRIVLLEREREALRAAHARLLEELELLKRRLFVAKAERVESHQLELEFEAKLAELDKLADTLGMAKRAAPPASPNGTSPVRPKRPPTGRRDLRSLSLAEERFEIADPAYEALVAEGKAARHGVEESVALMRKRGGMCRVVTARVKYRSLEQVNEKSGAMAIHTTPMPPVMFERSVATPSLVADIASRKICEGMPLFRIEDSYSREGVPVDRGSMSRWVEHLGATLGASIVHAMKAHAFRTAFCIATDATGISIQPVRSHEKQRRPCKRGHFLVQLADRDHVFFEYLERETSDAIGELFRGFGGYIQADAKSVFNVLFAPQTVDGDGCERIEVGCWSHARRKFWEAACAKSVVGREGLMRIGRMFELDASWRAKSPAEIKRLRNTHLRPHLDAFFAWARPEYETIKNERGLVNHALGYATRQQSPLTRFLDDGRLMMDNNRSERALRQVAVGRKAWLFAGSDDHATSTSHIFTMLASARLHGLDPQAYLRDIIRVLPHWPKDRYLELAPLFWARTRPRLQQRELDAEIGPLSIPTPLPDTAEQQSAS